MPTRMCPICHELPLTRREVKTCGSIECVTTWRLMSVKEKVQALQGDIRNDDFFSVEPSGKIARPIEKLPSKSTQVDNEFLEKIFGPDAPGVVKKDEEEDK